MPSSSARTADRRAAAQRRGRPGGGLNDIGSSRRSGHMLHATTRRSPGRRTSRYLRQRHAADYSFVRPNALIASYRPVGRRRRRPPQALRRHPSNPVRIPGDLGATRRGLGKRAMPSPPTPGGGAAPVIDVARGRPCGASPVTCAGAVVRSAVDGDAPGGQRVILVVTPSTRGFTSLYRPPRPFRCPHREVGRLTVRQDARPARRRAVATAKRGPTRCAPHRSSRRRGRPMRGRPRHRRSRAWDNSERKARLSFLAGS